MVIDPPPKLDSEESNIISGYFGISSENLSNGVTPQMVLTNILKSWDESKTQLHSSFTAMNPPEHISLHIFFIITK